MAGNDREVFQRIGGEENTNLEIDLLTYAMYAFEKNEWMEHHENNTGEYPSEVEINRWISQITDYRFDSYREDAARLFDLAAHNYMRNEMEREKAQAVRESILSEVKAAGSLWRQMGIALLTAILAPLIIGSIIAAALTYDRVMFSASYINSQVQMHETGKDK